MATTYNRATLSTFFQTGDVPSGSDYENLIYSQINIVDTSAQVMAGSLQSTELIASRISAGNGNFTGTTNTVSLFTNSLSVNAVLSAKTIQTSALNVGTTISAKGINVSAGINEFINFRGTGTNFNISLDNLFIGQGVSGCNINSNTGTITTDGNLVISGTFISAQNAKIFASAANIKNGVFCAVTIISAAGTTQATATSLTLPVCRLQGVTDGSTTGFVLLANQTGWSQDIRNETAVSGNLWPPLGGQINALGVNTAFALAANTQYRVVHYAASAYGVK